MSLILWTENYTENSKNSKMKKVKQRSGPSTIFSHQLIAYDFSTKTIAGKLVAMHSFVEYAMSTSSSPFCFLLIFNSSESVF